LFRIGALSQLKLESDKYSTAIAPVQEIRWKGEGIMHTGNFTVL
jgi:hypothetical protein